MYISGKHRVKSSNKNKAQLANVRSVIVKNPVSELEISQTKKKKQLILILKTDYIANMVSVLVWAIFFFTSSKSIPGPIGLEIVSEIS